MSIRIRVMGTDQERPEVPDELIYHHPKTLCPVRVGWKPSIQAPSNAQEVIARIELAQQLMSYFDGAIRFMQSPHALAVAGMRKPKPKTNLRQFPKQIRI